MIPATIFAGHRVAVVGLGGSGLQTCKSLLQGGAAIEVWDDNEAARDRARAQGFDAINPEQADWSRYSALVLAPGIPLTHPEPHWSVKRAQAADVEVIGDVEIFMRERARHALTAPVIAITGTNGKSTTTALISHILAACGRDVQMGGNIGVPVLGLENLTSDRVYVIEVSSYQIDLTPSLAPSVGVLLNVSPDHLDRHGTIENYAGIKARLPRASDTAVVCIDDPFTSALGQSLLQQRSGPTVLATTAGRLVDGYYLDDHRIYRACDGAPEAVADLGRIATLRGRHNAQNAMAAFAALEAIGLSLREISDALSTFAGLSHRLELVARMGRLTFINDSKATNAEAAGVALASFGADIYWICGGRAKEGGLDGLQQYFPRIAKAYLIGETEADFACFLEGKLDYQRCGNLETAIKAATADANKSAAREPVILLAPACASFDQFPSFEVRGDAFRDGVAALAGARLVGQAVSKGKSDAD